MKNLKNIYAVIIVVIAFFHAQICSAQYSMWSETLHENSVDLSAFTSATDREGNIYAAYITESTFSDDACSDYVEGDRTLVIKKFSPAGALLTVFDVLLDYSFDLLWWSTARIAVDKTGNDIYVLMTIDADGDIETYTTDICLAKYRKSAFGNYVLQWSRLLQSENADATDFYYNDIAFDLVLVQGYGGHQIYISGYMSNFYGSGQKYVVYRYDAYGNVKDFYTTTDQTVDGQTITVEEFAFGSNQFVHLKNAGGRLYAVTVMNHILTVGGEVIKKYDPIIIKFGEYIYPDNLSEHFDEYIFLDEEELVDYIDQVDVGRNNDVYLLGTGAVAGTDDPLTMVNCKRLADGFSWSTYSLASVPGTMEIQAMKLDDRGDNYLYIACYDKNALTYWDNDVTVFALRRNDGALYSSKTLNGVFDILFSEDVTVAPSKAIQFLVTNNHVYLTTNNWTTSEFSEDQAYIFVNKFSKNLSEYTFIDLIPYYDNYSSWTQEEYFDSKEANPKMQYHAGADVLSIIYNYNVTCEDEWGDDSSKDLIIRTHVDGLFGKEQDEAMLHTNRVELYPNPASDYIELSADTEMEMQYKILNAAGMLVGEGKMQQAATIDVKSLAKGIYTIQFFTQDTMMSSEKFIVQ